MSERTALVTLYRELAAHRLNNGSSGNVSLRMGDDMLISPSGATAETLTEDQLVRLPVTGPPLPGTVPSSEWALHAAVFAACPEAACVVHTHSDACTALSCLGEPLPPFHYMVLGFGGHDVPCAPYATFGTQELADAVRDTIPGYKACLLANHGMICHGTSTESALAAAIRLETLARQYLMARAAGQPKLLDAEALRQARQRYQSYGKPYVAPAAKGSAEMP
ncbi:MAG TPA: class II aldolase/adducin family protein [Roseomonas sp.]|nr:class II aldolase/adducin family protein [Roseomonas sp.]